MKPSAIRHFPASSRRGLTLLEVMIAAIIASLFLTGLFAAFNQVLRVSGHAEISMSAVANGRTALDAMAAEIKQANYFPGQNQFVGISAPLVYGDGVDDDQDGNRDEEQEDGQDNDNDWSVADDRHAEVSPGIRERQAFVGQADLGDGHVDEDVVFNQDELTQTIFPDASDPTPRDERIRFSIGSSEGRDHVLIKHVESPASSPNPTITESPLAEGVLSLNILYWQANGVAPYWVESWDSAGPEALLPPGLPLPAAVSIELQMYADDKPIEAYRPGDPVRVVRLSTVVNIEQVINDSGYPRP